MRNYFMIEKTTYGLFLSEGKGTPSPKDYDETEHWNGWKKIEDEKELFKRIKELLNK